MVSVSHQGLPSFVTFSDDAYTIAPSVTVQPGSYQVSGSLSDGIASTAFKFAIIVLAKPVTKVASVKPTNLSTVDTAAKNASSL